MKCFSKKTIRPLGECRRGEARLRSWRYLLPCRSIKLITIYKWKRKTQWRDDTQHIDTIEKIKRSIFPLFFCLKRDANER